MGANETSFKKGQVSNPRGRPPKTDAERAGEDFLRSRTVAHAKRLDELTRSDDEKIALGAVSVALKMTIGTLERQARPTGESQNPYKGWTKEEILTLARSRL